MTVISVLAFLGGVILAQLLCHSWFIWMMLILSVILLLILRWRLPHYFPIALFYLLGYLWCFVYLTYLSQSTLSPALENQTLVLTGKVTTFPTQNEWGSHFVMAIETLKTLKGERLFNRGYVQLHAKNNNFVLGNTYQCLAVIRHLHALSNPGVISFENLALANHIRWKGSVLKCESLSTNFNLREKIREKLIAILPPRENIAIEDDHARAWLMALILGDRSQIPASDWSVLENTGTNHLMAIGGLHLGMVAGLAAALTAFFWRRSVLLMSCLDVMRAAAMTAWLMSVIYTILSGFSIATSRAFLMLSVFTLSLFLMRRLSLWQCITLALIIALILNPLIVLSPAFWFSFTTIALIIMSVSARPYLSRFSQFWRIQAALTLGLLPLSLYYFQAVPLLSAFINIIAIPWLGLLILPFCFMGMILLPVLPQLTSYCFFFAEKSLSLLWRLLAILSQQENLIYHHPIQTISLLFLTSAGLLLLMSPRGTTARLLGWILILPLMIAPQSGLKNGDIHLSILDVGQGLSVVVQTAHHVLVYDAGGHLYINDDKGKQVVLPFLRYQGIQRIDTLVISHGDNDHAGGAVSLMNALPTSVLLTSVPEKFQNTHPLACHAGQVFQWDNVFFRVLSPPIKTSMTGNNASCVLLIDNGFHRILLPGDIEASAEALLLTTHEKLNADILVAPHHGSATSSTPDFIRAVSPAYVIYSTGFYNHYGLPDKKIQQRYARLKIKALNTVDHGAIQFEMNQQVTLI